MLDAIFSCKLFKASSRQSKIRSALSDPVNSELVQQLRSYLDEPYKKKEYLDPESDTKPKDTDTDMDNDSDNLEDSEISEGENNKVSKPGVGNSRLSMPNIKPNDIPDNENVDVGVEPKPESESKSEDENSDLDNVQESTKVVANTCLFSELQSVVSELKGSLNLRSDTTGVNRILQKENELWIYYNDSINLNNIMAPVIEFVNASGYTYLEFNRLARSDNAIVFQINLVDTDIAVNPMGESNG